MNIITRQRRALLLTAAAVGVVWLSGCGDNGASTGGGGSGSYDYVTIGGKKWMKKNLNVVDSYGVRELRLCSEHGQ